MLDGSARSYIIILSYYFLNETIDLCEHLRHWAFELDGIDEHELHGGHAVLPNFCSDFNFRGCRVMITGSLLGRYDKEPQQPLIRESYNLLRDSIAEKIIEKLQAKYVVLGKCREVGKMKNPC
jgi:hypothetical protein